MGKGDQKTRRGKIIRGSYGKNRTRNSKPAYVAVEAPKVVEEIKPEVKPNVKKEKVKAPPKPKAEKEKKEVKSEIPTEEKAG